MRHSPTRSRSQEATTPGLDRGTDPEREQRHANTRSAFQGGGATDPQSVPVDGRLLREESPSMGRPATPTLGNRNRQSLPASTTPRAPIHGSRLRRTEIWSATPCPPRRSEPADHGRDGRGQLRIVLSGPLL